MNRLKDTANIAHSPFIACDHVLSNTEVVVRTVKIYVLTRDSVFTVASSVYECSRTLYLHTTAQYDTDTYTYIAITHGARLTLMYAVNTQHNLYEQQKKQSNRLLCAYNTENTYGTIWTAHCIYLRRQNKFIKSVENRQTCWKVKRNLRIHSRTRTENSKIAFLITQSQLAWIFAACSFFVLLFRSEKIYISENPKQERCAIETADFDWGKCQIIHIRTHHLHLCGLLRECMFVYVNTRSCVCVCLSTQVIWLFADFE